MDGKSRRAFVASRGLDLFPRLMREELLSDSSLLEQLGITAEPLISFGNNDTIFSRSELFNAIRSAFEYPKLEHFLDSTNGTTWAVISDLSNPLSLVLSKGNDQIINNEFWALHPDVSMRIHSLGLVAKQYLCSSKWLESWSSRLSVPDVQDDDVSDLVFDLGLSPKHIEGLLRKEFRSSEQQVAAFVPNDIRYYERLVGSYQGSENIADYCELELKQFIQDQLENGVTEYNFLICVQGLISSLISNESLDEVRYKEIVSQALDTHHPILLISCIEVGLLKFGSAFSKEIQALFASLSSEDTLDNLKMFCALSVFVDGELARQQIFRDMPPFYRRLASFSQASLICKVALEEKIEFETLEHWALQHRGLHFYCQSFLDLLREPRWLPSYLTAEQFSNELYGRVRNACSMVNGPTVVNDVLAELVSSSNFVLASFLPGPLEGNLVPVSLPDEIAKLFTKHTGDEASLDALKILMNSAPFWSISSEYLDRIVALLEREQHKLAEARDRDTVYQILRGLAFVSCLTRKKDVAASVKVLSRTYRDYIDVDSGAEDYLALGFIAGAAFEDKNEWAEFVGQWVNDLIYMPISGNAVRRIQSMLEMLCILEPYLYYTCSKSLDILSMLRERSSS